MPWDDPDTSFHDKPAGGRVFNFTVVKLDKLWEMVEEDEDGAVASAAKYFRVSESCIYSTLKRSGKKKNVVWRCEFIQITDQRELNIAK